MFKPLSKYQHLINLFFTKTAINTYAIFTGNIISAFFAFVFTVTAVKAMTIEDFGYFSAMLSFLLLVSDLSDIGIGSTLARFLPQFITDKKRFNSFLKSAFFVQSTIIIFVSLLLFFLSGFLSKLIFNSVEFKWLVHLIILGIISAVYTNFFNNTLTASMRFFLVSFLIGFEGSLRVVFLIAVIFFSGVTLRNVVWTQVLTLIVSAVLGVWAVKLNFLKNARLKGDTGKLLSFAWFIGVARGLTSVASRLDVLMLVSLVGPASAGIYSIASRVISIYPLLSGSFSTVLAPRMSTIKEKKDIDRYLKRSIFGASGIIGTVIIMLMISQPFLVALFGEKAIPAVEVFRYLLVSMIFFVASIPSVTLCIYYLHKPFILSLNSVLQLIIVIAGNLIFIPKFGTTGPAISLIFAYGITLFTTIIMSIYFLRKKHAKT